MLNVLQMQHGDVFQTKSNTKAVLCSSGFDGHFPDSHILECNTNKRHATIIMDQAAKWYTYVTTTVKTVLSEHIKQDIFSAFQGGGCLLLHESALLSFSFSNKQSPVNSDAHIT